MPENLKLFDIEARKFPFDPESCPLNKYHWDLKATKTKDKWGNIRPCKRCKKCGWFRWLKTN